MKKELDLEKVARDIANFEKRLTKDNTNKEEVQKEFEDFLMNIISQYKLGIFEMMALDEMVQDILQ